MKPAAQRRLTECLASPRILAAIGVSVALGAAVFAARCTREARPPSPRIEPSREAGAPAWRALLWGFIDRTGRFAIEPRFDDAWSFHDGVAAVALQTGPPPGALRWGYVKPDGTLLAMPRFVDADDFHDGVSVVRCEGGQYGYLGKSGAMTVPCELAGACASEDGVAIGFARGAAGSARPEKADGCIGYAGEQVRLFPRGSLPAGFDRLVRWSDGPHATRLVSVKGRIHGPAMERAFDTIGAFSAGLAVVCADDGMGVVDARGRVVIPPGPRRIEGDIAEGRIPFSRGERCERRYGFFDATGQIVIEPKYVAVDGFSEGLAAACADSSGDGQVDPATGCRGDLQSECGYIDRAGGVVIPFELTRGSGWSLERVRPFRSGLAAVSVRGPDGRAWGYVDETGAMVIPPRFADAGGFSVEGLAPAEAGTH